MGLGKQAVLSAVAGVALMVAVSDAHAQTSTIPNGTLVPGDVRRTFVQRSGAWCSIDGGATYYRRTGPNEVFVDFPEVLLTEYTIPTSYHRQRGVGRLTFTAATSGTITFDFTDETVPAIAQPAFTLYSETWDAAKKRLTVQFNIKFSPCVMRYVAHYFAP
jgi:hypothetical protein